MDRLDQAIALIEKRVEIGVVAEAVGLTEDQIKAGMALRGAPIPRSFSSGKASADECLEIMFEIARYSKHDGTRLKAATTVRNDLLGREDKVQGNSAEQDAFLERLTQRAEQIRATRAAFFKKPIDV